MIILTIEKLKEEGIDLKGKQTFSFQNKSYAIVTKISKRFQSKIHKIIETHDAEGLSSVVVEHGFYCSIWKEEKPLDETKENLDSFINQKLREFGL